MAKRQETQRKLLMGAEEEEEGRSAFLVLLHFLGMCLGRLRSSRPLGYSARCLFRQRLHVRASVLAAALEASPVSVTVIAENWNDYTGGTASDRHQDEQFLLCLRMPVDFVPTSPAIQTFLALLVASIGVSLRWSATSVSRPVRIVLGVLFYPGLNRSCC